MAPRVKTVWGEVIRVTTLPKVASDYTAEKYAIV